MSRHRTFKVDRDAMEYTGRYAPYDLVKEGAVALLVMAVLTIGLAVVFGSPDEHALTLKQWSSAAPTDFVATAATELAGTSGTATYGPPYNHAQGNVQKLGPFALPSVLGVRIPIDTARDFVLDPLRSQPGPRSLHAALTAYSAASAAQRDAWSSTYADNAVNQDGSPRVQFVRGHVVMPPGNYGPVSAIMQFETQIARSGALDQALITGKGFYTTDYTRPSLFLADGAWFAGIGAAQNLGGDQWGMTNETGGYPGQAWLWLYTTWYQVPPFTQDNAWGMNADVLIWALMLVLTAILALVPFIPGVRSIPRWTRVHRLIWRVHYRERETPTV